MSEGQDIIGLIIDFLSEIGLNVVRRPIETETFLPGIYVEAGTLVVDESRLTYPGDMLHEAGHLAVAAPSVRDTLHGKVAFPSTVMEPIEAQAIAWSYAAALHLEIDPSVVFHSGGYRGNADALLNSFSLGVYIGVQGLEDAELTLTPSRAAGLKRDPYPKMLRWVRE